MKLEPRYVVVKLKDMEVAGVTSDELAAFNAVCDKVSASRIGAGKGLLEVLVIEKDWPEYRPTVAALSARVDGEKPAVGLPDESYWRDRYMQAAGKLDAAHDSMQLINVAFGAALDKLGGKMTASRADLQRIDGRVVVGGASSDSFTFELKAVGDVTGGGLPR